LTHRLLDKIAHHGIGGRVWEWIKNWLSGRRQRVYVCNSDCSCGEKLPVADLHGQPKNQNLLNPSDEIGGPATFCMIMPR